MMYTARRSPRPPFRGAPRPRTRNVLPLGVPAGTFSVTGPFIVGTSTLAPSAASGYVIGSSTVRSSPRRPKIGWGSTATLTNRSPAAPPTPPGSPFPARRMRAPSRTPAGILTRIVRVRRCVPEPPHVVHAVSTIRPLPPHVGHGRDIEKNPWFSAISPVPAHVGHVVGDVPGSAPLPPHREQVAGPSIRIGSVVPRSASSKEIVTDVSRSAPRRAPARPPPRRPAPPNTPPKMSD